MNELEVCINEQISMLDEIISQAKDVMNNSPEGKLRVAQKVPPQYYWVHSGTDHMGKYIKQSNRDLASQLANKDYAKQVCCIAEELKRELVNNSMGRKLDELEHLHEILLPARQELIAPFWITDIEYARLWEQRQRLDNRQMIEERYPLTEENGIVTEKGGLVRSKSEKILADKLYMMGVPYIYEKPLYLKGIGYIHPDFQVLNKRLRREFYWEHFGMMDNAEYCEKAIRKISCYEKNGIYVGKQLLVTYETSTQVLNPKQLEEIIKEFLL